MKEMTLREIQQVSLDILKDIHEFCVKNGIKYTIAYGTLIGAIRHKGFIPWDDDIDVLMPRPDYERFFSSYSSSRFTPYYPQPGKSYLAFGHVCDNIRTVTRTTLPMQPAKMGDKGVWVDVFPLDGESQDDMTFRNDMQTLLDMVHKEHEYRGSKQPLEWGLSWFDIKRILRRRISCIGYNIDESLAKRMDLIQRYDYESSEYVGNLAFVGYSFKERYPRKFFDKIIKLPFEGYEFCACEGYDEVLRTIYGDYMQLPPEEKRVPKMDYIKFYWK